MNQIYIRFAYYADGLCYASFKRIKETKPKPDLFEGSVEIEPIPGENEIAIMAFNV